MVLLRLDRVEKLIANDSRLAFTVTCYVLSLAFYVNLTVLKSPVVGAVASILYFIINGVFLANAFLDKEAAFFRIAFGFLLFIMLLSFVSWLVMIIYNLDIIMFISVLVIATTFSSWLNRRMRHKNAG